MTMRLGRVLALLGGVIAAVLVLALPASAHADLVWSTPDNGTLLRSEPNQVVLVFSEEVTARLSWTHVIAPDGQRVDGAPAADGDVTLVAPLRRDGARGTFVVSWHAVAADDGHATAGVLTFVVGSPSPLPANLNGTATPTSTADLLDVATWLSFLGFALLAGYFAVRLGCLPAGLDTRLPTWPAVTGWLTLFGATLLQLLLYGPYAAGVGPGRLLDRNLLADTLSARMGEALLVRAGALVVIAVLGDWLLARRPSVRWWLVAPAAVVVLTLAVTWSVTSHAADGEWTALAMSITTLHLTAMGVWAGGLVTLWLLLGQAGGDVAVARFSQLALTAVLVLMATGLFQAVREIGGFPALVSTAYGRLLLLKLAVLLIVLAVASRSRRRVHTRPEGGPAGLRRTVLLEAVGLVVLLAVTTLLIGSAPPTSLA